MLLLPAFSLGKDAYQPLNLLTDYSPPAAILIGANPESIERPSEPMGLVTSILTATENLKIVPQGHTLEAAPLWWFLGRTFTYKSYSSNNMLSSICQTFSISAATSLRPGNLDTLDRLWALGTRVSILRGKVDETFDGYAQTFVSLNSALDKIADYHNALWACLEENDPALDTLQGEKREARLKELSQIAKATLAGKKDTLHEVYIELLESDSVMVCFAQEIGVAQEVAERIISGGEPQLLVDIERLSAKLSQLRLRRVGPKLELAGAVSWIAPQGRLTLDSLNRWAVWATGGWDIPDKDSTKDYGVFTVARYLEDRIDTSQSRWSFGARGNLDFNLPWFEEFSVSGEGAYRLFRYANAEAHPYRYELSITYALTKNNAVTISMGQEFDFDGDPQSNSIASLSITQGFGSKRLIR